MSLLGYDYADDLLGEDEVGAPLSTLETLLRGFMLSHGNLIASLPKREPMKRMATETYLDGEFCPPGTAPCVDDDCPEEGLNLFTASGEECYDNSVVRSARTKRVNDLKKRTKKQPQLQDNRQMLVAVRELSEIVKAAAVLSSRIQGIGHANVTCSGVSSLTSDKDKQRAFCGTLTTASGERRCQFDDAAKTCNPIAGVAQPAGPAAAAVAPVAPAPMAPAPSVPSGPSAEELAAQEARRRALAAAAETVAEERAANYQEASNELAQAEANLARKLRSSDQDNVKKAVSNANYALNLLKPGVDLEKAKTDTAADVTTKVADASTAVTQTRTAMTEAQASIATGLATLKGRGENPLAGGADEADDELEALRKDALLQVTLFQGLVQSALNELPSEVQNLTADAAHELGLKANEHAANLKEQFDHLQTTNELYLKAAKSSKNKALSDQEKQDLRAIANTAAKLSSGELQVYPKLVALSTSLEKSETVQAVSALKEALATAGNVDDKSQQLSAVIELYKEKFIIVMTKLQAKFDAMIAMYAEQKAAADAALAQENVSDADKTYYTTVSQIAPVVLANLSRKRNKLNKFAAQPLPAEFVQNLEQVQAVIDAANKEGKGPTVSEKLQNLLMFGVTGVVLDRMGVKSKVTKAAAAAGVGVATVAAFLKFGGVVEYLKSSLAGLQATQVPTLMIGAPAPVLAIGAPEAVLAIGAPEVAAQAAGTALAPIVSNGVTLLSVSGPIPNMPPGIWETIMSKLQEGGTAVADFVANLDPATAAKVVAILTTVASLGWATRSYYKKKKGESSSQVAPLFVIKGKDIDTEQSLKHIVDAFTKGVAKLNSVYDHVSMLPTVTDKASLMLQTDEAGKKVTYRLDAKKHPVDKFSLKKLNAAELALLSLNPSETLKGYNVPCGDFNTVFKGDTETQGRVCRTAFTQGDQEGGVPKCAYSVDEDIGKDKSIQANQCYDAADYNTKTTYASASDSYRGSRYSTYAYLEDDLNKIIQDPEGYEVDAPELARLAAIRARLELYKKNGVPFRLSAEEFDLWATILGVAGQGHFSPKEKRFPEKFKE